MHCLFICKQLLLSDPFFHVKSDPFVKLQYEKGDPKDKILQNLFGKFNVVNPLETKSSTLLIAEALKEPIADFKKLPWKELLNKYDRYSLRHWLAQVMITTSCMNKLRACCDKKISIHLNVDFYPS